MSSKRKRQDDFDSSKCWGTSKYQRLETKPYQSKIPQYFDSSEQLSTNPLEEETKPYNEPKIQYNNQESQKRKKVKAKRNTNITNITNIAKKKKQSIPKQVRVIVWNHYIGEDINKHRCLCCKKVLINNRQFDVGHVISVRDGGTDEINNLRPICSPCNHSMGSKNMIEFVKTYGYYIG